MKERFFEKSLEESLVHASRGRPGTVRVERPATMSGVPGIQQRVGGTGIETQWRVGAGLGRQQGKVGEAAEIEDDPPFIGYRKSA